MDTSPPVDGVEQEEEEETADAGKLSDSNPPVNFAALSFSSKLSFLLAPEPVDFDNNLAAVGKLLSFGRELQQLYMGLAEESPNRELQVLLQDTYSLLAYPNPRNSPVGYLLDPAQREPVCAALNSAILSECTVFVLPVWKCEPLRGVRNFCKRSVMGSMKVIMFTLFCTLC